MASFCEPAGAALANKLDRPRVVLFVEPLAVDVGLVVANNELLTAGAALDDCTSGTAADMTPEPTPGMTVPVA